MESASMAQGSVLHFKVDTALGPSLQVIDSVGLLLLHFSLERAQVRLTDLLGKFFMALLC